MALAVGLAVVRRVSERRAVRVVRNCILIMVVTGPWARDRSIEVVGLL